MPAAAPAAPVYSGVDGQIVVRTPRMDGRPVVDGLLDEPQWAQAAVLRGFSQYTPLDGRPAEDSTVAYVWYGRDAIYFGIRAYAPAGAVHATLADRDKIENDDNVQVILDTFNDNRRAFVFAVNPLGVQADGVRSEGRGPGGGGRGGGGGGGGGGPGFSRLNLGGADLNQDMVWESKGHVTAFGYEVEMRIPFNAVRYDPGNDTWGLNIVRTSQYNGFQDSWAPARRGMSSVLIQSGRLRDLRDLHRGLVLDVMPVVTSLTAGARRDTIPGTTVAPYGYASSQALGADIRWGVRPNLTLNATVHPDFSQVEADAGQIPGDVRFALFFPELRPFFVEGSEVFDVPNQLVYTRKIVQPVGAAKLSGKVGASDVAVLGAADAASYSTSGRDTPLFGAVRVRRDVGSQSTLGFVVTDREDGNRYNRVGAVDGRFVFRNVYNVAFQGGGSISDSGTGPRFGQLWEASIDRSGRSYGFRNSLQGIGPLFRTEAGFVNRTNNVELSLNQRYTYFGVAGSRVQQLMLFLSSRSVWTYGGFFGGASALESRLSLNMNATLRGGWTVNVQPAVQRDRFDPAAYDRRYVVRRMGAMTDTVPFVPGDPVASTQVQARVQTPQFERWAANANVTYGSDAEYLETGRARRLDVSTSLELRPTQQVRATLTMLHQEFLRDADGSAVLLTNIPRLRLEYQASRAVQLRFIGQYESRTRDALRDPRTGDPLLSRSNSGTWSAYSRTRSNALRADWLLTYLPSPGRVMYLGYGATLTQDDAFSFGERPRVQSDGLFVKVSYQVRLR